MPELWQLINLGIIALCIIALYFLFNGAPYLPTSINAVNDMVKLAAVQPGQRMVDIGSGDGRILIAFAKAGAIAEGYEINPILVWWSRKKIREAGVQDRCRVTNKNFWSVHFADTDIVTLFGIRGIMPRLEKKFRAEMRPGSKVLSHIFTFPTWQPTQETDATAVRLYVA